MLTLLKRRILIAARYWLLTLNPLAPVGVDFAIDGLPQLRGVAMDVGWLQGAVRS